MKKRILSILLLCCMVLTLLPTTAFAEGELRAGTNVTVTFDSAGGSPVEPQSVPQGQPAQRPADPIKDGYTFIGWYNKDDLPYNNMPEWNFSYSVTKDMVLVAQWMEPMPISTEPITYLDKDGNQQVCNKYTVLTGNTADSILDLQDKWYDLPAGWYVVKGDVTITPRLDTHGAVNLILTDGSHLTAEWGINVKEGDTFTVYAQSTGEDTMGKLTACLPEDFNSDGSVDYVVWPYKGLSGIGGSVRWKGANNGIYESEGTIVINGGNIRAKGQDRASAIGGTLSDYAGVDRGGFFSEKRLGGSITINGGIVRTEAITRGNAIYAFSVGIGSCCSGYGGSVTINGGTVIANAANSAISAGWDGSITINGGTVTATGGINNFTVGKDALILGNGIGPYWNGTVTVNGGKIKASTAGQGSGIGGSRSPTKVIINGGDIEAVADQNGTGQNGAESISAAGIGGVGSVSITGGSISATGNGGAAGIGGDAEISITGGEITVSATGTGAAIGGAAGEDCGSIHIQGDVLKSVSSVNGACIGAANGKGSGNITIANVKLPSLSGNYILIGWDVDSPGGTLTIRNSRVASTDIPTRRTDGIRVGSNSEIVIEESEIRLPHYRSVRAGDNGSIAVRDSDLHTYGIFMDETVRTITDAKTLKKLEITDSTVVTGDIIGVRGGYSSVEEIVIRNSNISLDSTDPYNSYSIGCGTSGSFGSIDIQNSTIDIPRGTDSAAIGSAMGGSFTGESLIRIADSQVTVACLRRSPAIGAGVSSYGNGKLKIYIENSNVTAKGGSLRIDSDYIPGIGRRGSADKPEVYIQILNSTVESLRHTKTGVEDNSDLVYDDLHEKNLPGIPAENISICGSTVNGKTIDHSFDEYGKCTLCGKYDLGYCYEHGLLTMEGLTDCISDGSEKKLTGLSHKTGENETKQLAENTDYTASYSNNVHPYTLTPDDAGFDSEKAPKVTLYGTGNYCGKAEHYFTISAGAPAAKYTVRFNANGGGGTMADVTGVTGSYTLPACGFTEPEGKQFKGWSTSADGSVISGTTYEVSSDTTFYAIWESKEYSIIVTDGTATIGAGSEISKAAAGTAVTLTANAAPDGKVFDKWEVVSGGITLADANSASTTFTMPAEAVSVKATYKNAPVTTYSLTTQVNGGHGTISASKTGLAAGSTETVIFTPDAGYEIDTVTVNGTATSVSGNTLNVTMNENKTVIVTYKATGGGEHTHSYGSEWKYDADNHWHECSCGDKTDVAAHTASDWIIDTPATATADGTKHKECTVCKRVLETGTIPATGGSEHSHSYGSEWKNDATNHWHECSCGDKADKAAHSFKWVVDKEATATKKGSKHQECKVCGYKKAAVEIPATGSTTKPSDPTQTNPSTGAESPKTGDNSNMILWIALLFVSGGAVIGITVYSKKKKENAE